MRTRGEEERRRNEVPLFGTFSQLRIFSVGGSFPSLLHLAKQVPLCSGRLLCNLLFWRRDTSAAAGVVLLWSDERNEFAGRISPAFLIGDVIHSRDYHAETPVLLCARFFRSLVDTTMTLTRLRRRSFCAVRIKHPSSYGTIRYSPEIVFSREDRQPGEVVIALDDYRAQWFIYAHLW